MKLKRIYHLSDIHIRNFKRHEEYRRVFARVYEFIEKDLQKNPDSIVCLTGDIVHAKTDITPELIQEVQLFLSSLANLTTTLLIPGNHDANLNNNHRLDSLTPIVNALNHSNLIYVKNTEVVNIQGVSFCHWSVFDNPHLYTRASEVQGEYKIAMYHGPVTGFLTENGTYLEENDVRVEDFEGFDLVLLGDIHKRQFLNEGKTIAYPGSLIQQNHAEQLHHGFMIWDLDQKTGEFINVYNDTAFYTLEVNEGFYQEIPSEYPTNLYLRIRHKNTSALRIKEILSEIKLKRNVLEASIQKVTDFSLEQEKDRKSCVIDLRDVEQQNNAISEYLTDLGELEEEEIKQICEINRSINAKITKLEVPRNVIWTPKTFEFEDMFSYGKGNKIDFSSMEGINGIFAPNASGKSTLLDSITYCLFDKCSKTSKSGQVMNNQSDTFKCKLTFELHDKIYVIERRGLRQKSGNIRVEVDFYYEDSNGKTSLNGKDRNETNDNIKLIVGNYEDFLLTALSAQNCNTGFIDMSQKDRKDLLSQFLDINLFEQLFELANEKTKEIGAVLKEFQKDDYYQLLSDSKNKVEQISWTLESSKKKTEDLESRKEILRTKELELVSQLVPVKSQVTDQESLEKSLETAKTAYENIKYAISKKELEIQQIESDIESIESSNDFSELSTIKQVERGRNDLKNKDHEFRVSLGKIESTIKHQEEKLEKLKELKYDENCKFCMDNIFVKDAINTKKLYELEIEKKKDIIDQIAKHKDLIDQINLRLEKLTNLKETELDLKNKKSNLTILKLERDKLCNKRKEAERVILEISQSIELCKKEKDTIRKNEEIDSELTKLRSALADLEKEIKQSENENNSNLISLKLAENEVEKYKTSIAKVKSLSDSAKHYQYYLKAVHRDGVPHRLISNTIPQIEDEINNILSGLVDFKIVLQADDKNINAYIAYGEENYWPLELTSGMEKFVSSLAIRVSLINVSTLPRPNFIAIDEGFGALDQTNLSSMVMLFDYLKTQFKFAMIISHIESMRDIVDSIIEIVKKDGKSKIDHQ